MTHVFVFTNHKGGIGKPTSATNMALGLSSVLKSTGASNARVLRRYGPPRSSPLVAKITAAKTHLYTVLMAERANAAKVMNDCIVQSESDADLHLLPVSPMLEGAERELIGVAGAPYRISDPLSKIINHYAAVVIDTRPSFSLLTEMALIAATDALIPVEPRYLETVGLLSVIGKINEVRDGWRIPTLKVGGIVITKMDARIKGHVQLCVFSYDPKASASKAYAELVITLIRRMVQR